MLEPKPGPALPDTHELADAGKVAATGARTGDAETRGAGEARVVAFSVKTGVGLDLAAKVAGLDKLPTVEAED